MPVCLSISAIMVKGIVTMKQLNRLDKRIGSITFVKVIMLLRFPLESSMPL